MNETLNSRQMKDKLYTIFMSAMDAAGIVYDTDCNTVWVDCKDGKTLSFTIEEMLCVR